MKDIDKEKVMNWEQCESMFLWKDSKGHIIKNGIPF